MLDVNNIICMTHNTSSFLHLHLLLATVETWCQFRSNILSLTLFQLIREHVNTLAWSSLMLLTQMCPSHRAPALLFFPVARPLLPTSLVLNSTRPQGLITWDSIGRNVVMEMRLTLARLISTFISTAYHIGTARLEDMRSQSGWNSMC